MIQQTLLFILLCRAIDSGACMDVLEIDAASNNGVDNVRDLRDDAVYTPSQVKKRVYIIDEVHMLSISAFNALLKIIEEPPEHLLFILATTELHKVPATILSRCQRFSFRRISQEDIAARLQYVAYQENIDLDEGAARVLARLADGGMRDGLSLLDQCASATAGELNADKVYACLGIAGIRECAQVIAAIADQDTKAALSILNESYAQGKDMGALLDELACLIRDLIVMQSAPREGITLLSGVASEADVKQLVDRFTFPELIYMMNTVQKTVNGFTKSASRRVDTELCIVNLCQPQLHLNLESINARLGKVEEQLKNGVVTCGKALSSSAVQDEELPPLPDDTDAPPEPNGPSDKCVRDDSPVGFWADLTTEIRKELKPPVTGFFAPTPNAPVQGALSGDVLELRCANGFTKEVVNKPDILALIGRKASAMLGKNIRVVAIDKTAVPGANQKLEALLDFGRAHSDVIKIRQDG